MSIIGEFVYGLVAKDLEKVLLAAINDSKFGDHRSATKGFARETIYPLYFAYVNLSCGEVSMNPELEKIFGKHEKN